MNSNSNLSTYPEKEINLTEIFKILIRSKKLFILSILIFTLAGIIYSLNKKPEFESSVLIKVGYYNSVHGTQKLIELPSDLISHLNVFEISNRENDELIQEVSMKSIEEKLIKLETVSNSSGQNEIILNKYINHALEHHNFLLNQNLNSLITNINNKISQVNFRISYTKSKIAEYSESSFNELLEKYDLTNTEDRGLISVYINKKNQFETQLFYLEEELNLLESDLNKINSQNIQGTEVVGSLSSKTLESSKIGLISVFFIFGVIISMFLVIFNNFVKSLK
jgi:LPS O-antigen subunit length determinant protein (WzzB/FepE family)